MKYIIILLVSTISIISVAGKIPDYIQVCKRNDPKISVCVKNSIYNMKEKLASGIPELHVPSIDPLHLEKLSLNLGRGFSAEGRDLVLTGGRNFEIRDLAVDLKANTASFTVTIPEIVATGNYQIDAAIASIPLKGKGPMQLTATSVVGRGTLHNKLVTRRGKTYNWYPSMELKFEIGDYKMKLDNLFEGDPTIGEVASRLLNEEKAEVLGSLLPGLEKSVSEYILLCANNIGKHFTWDELLPAS